MQNVVLLAQAMQYAVYFVSLYFRPQQSRQATYKTHSKEYSLREMLQASAWNKYHWKQHYYGDSAAIGIVYEILPLNPHSNDLEYIILNSCVIRYNPMIIPKPKIPHGRSMRGGNITARFKPHRPVGRLYEIPGALAQRQFFRVWLVLFIEKECRPWRPLRVLLSWYPINNSRHWSSFVDYPKFKWDLVTGKDWESNRIVATRWRAPFLLACRFLYRQNRTGAKRKLFSCCFFEISHAKWIVTQHDNFKLHYSTHFHTLRSC